MSEKVTKTAVREDVYTILAKFLICEYGLMAIGRSKDGLVVRLETDEGAKDVAVRVIEKKDLVEAKDIKRMYELDEAGTLVEKGE